MRVLIIGPQGSGKSTQSKLLGKFLKIPVISTGDIFRALSSSESEEGKRIRAILGAGKLVDDKTTAEIVKKRLEREKDFIMDGYPRTIEQMKIFDPLFDKVIYLDVPQDMVINRLMLRGRADDTSELIRQRLDLYYKQTQPLLDYYKKMGNLLNIDGRREIEKIQQDLRSHFN